MGQETSPPGLAAAAARSATVSENRKVVVRVSVDDEVEDEDVAMEIVPPADAVEMLTAPALLPPPLLPANATVGSWAASTTV
jgi:hypothetical protein